MRSVLVEQPDRIELRLKTHGWRRAWVWWPAAAMLLVILGESTDTMSSAHTSSFLRPLFQAVFGTISDTRWELVNHLIRKTGHFCGYGLVSLAFLRAWLIELGRSTERTLTSWRVRATLLAVLSAAAVASLDEWHQSMIPSRTGKPQDVLLDTCGAAVSCALVWLFSRRGSDAPRLR